MGGQHKANKNGIKEVERLNRLSHILEDRSRRDNLKMLYSFSQDIFDLMLDIIEDDEFAEKVSVVLQKDISELRNKIENIIDTLLFNNLNNPYMALALPEDADKETAKERWKRLITLFHPDKYQNNPVYEERSKRINEAYRELSNFKKSYQKNTQTYHTFDPNRWQQYWRYSDWQTSKDNNTFGKQRFSRHLTAIIISLSVMIAIITITLFVYKIKTANRYSADVSTSQHREETETSEIKNTNKVKIDNPQLTLKESADFKEDFTITELETFSVDSFEKDGSDNIQTSNKSNTSYEGEKNDNIHLFKHFTENFYDPKKPEDTTISYKTAKEEHRKKIKEDIDVPKKSTNRATKIEMTPLMSDKTEIAKLPRVKLEKDTGKLSSSKESDAARKTVKSFSDEEIINEINHRIDRFISYYEEGNISKYLSLFSPRGMENGMPVKRLREEYLKIFDDNVKNKLKIENIFIRINSKKNVIVSADYNLNRFDIKNIEYKKFSGKIQWEFEKEGKDFLIKTLQYDRN